MGQENKGQTDIKSNELPCLFLDDPLNPEKIKGLSAKEIDNAVFSGMAKAFSTSDSINFLIDEKLEASNILENSGTVLQAYRRQDITQEEKEKYWSKF